MLFESPLCAESRRKRCTIDVLADVRLDTIVHAAHMLEKRSSLAEVGWALLAFPTLVVVHSGNVACQSTWPSKVFVALCAFVPYASVLASNVLSKVTGVGETLVALLALPLLLLVHRRNVLRKVYLVFTALATRRARVHNAAVLRLLVGSQMARIAILFRTLVALPNQHPCTNVRLLCACSLLT